MATAPTAIVIGGTMSTNVTFEQFYHAGANTGRGNTQFLTYLIPGPEGDLTPGKRSLNWVWYENYRPAGVDVTEGRNTIELETVADMLTDDSGVLHEWSIPAGHMSPLAKSAMLRKSASLPACMRAVVNSTPSPFIQALSDVSPPSSTLVYSHGHVIFTGDSVVGPRPHTAASTNQCAMHALTLFHVLQHTSELDAIKSNPYKGKGRNEAWEGWERLLREEWETKARSYARMLYATGKEMGDRSQFGVHPFSVDKEVGGKEEKGLSHPHERSLSRTLSGVAL
ncbi:hypothetical protein P7C70_g4684, partial [Phenoliferia sp. Uapishka_3]